MYSESVYCFDSEVKSQNKCPQHASIVIEACLHAAVHSSVIACILKESLLNYLRKSAKYTTWYCILSVLLGEIIYIRSGGNDSSKADAKF